MRYGVESNVYRGGGLLCTFSTYEEAVAWIDREAEVLARSGQGGYVDAWVTTVDEDDRGVLDGED